MTYDIIWWHYKEFMDGIFPTKKTIFFGYFQIKFGHVGWNPLWRHCANKHMKHYHNVAIICIFETNQLAKWYVYLPSVCIRGEGLDNL